MELRQLLINHHFDCYESGDFYPNESIINAVANWVLTKSDHPEEMWEDPGISKLIGGSCVSLDFTAMAVAIRKEATKYAEQLISENESLIRDVHFENTEIM